MDLTTYTHNNCHQPSAQSQSYIIALYNDTPDRSLYIACNGQNYRYVRAQETTYFNITELQANVSILVCNNSQNLFSSSNILSNRPLYHARLLLSPDAPAYVTIAYSTIAALTKLEVIQNIPE